MTKNKRIALRIDTKLRNDLIKQAKKEGRTLSDVIHRTLQEAFNADNPKHRDKITINK